MGSHSRILLALVVIVAVCGCATIDRPVVGTLEGGKSVSPVLSAPASSRNLKRKVAIARFSNETKYDKSIFFDEDKERERASRQATDILSAKLTATEKFILLERADIDKINNELKYGRVSSLKIPADYLILGSISEFGRKDTSQVGIFSRTKKQTAYAKVNIRLVDIVTNQVIYSEEGEGEAFTETGTVMGLGGRASYDSTLNDKAASAAISKMVSNIVERLLNKPWRSFILSKDGDYYVISGGKTQGVRMNDVFNVYKKGATVKNPQTGIPVELPGKLVGKLVVMQLVGKTQNDELSVCSVAEGNLPGGGFEDYYVEEKE